MKTSAIAIAAVLAVSLTGMAQATTTARKVYQQVVSYGDLNLENEADAAILHGRIKSAARNVCGMKQTLIPIELKSPVHACVEDAMARAIADVNAPKLTRQGRLVVRN
ncbi:MAG: UrcA family protein [Steroidobacteraceae bacterium]